METTPDAADRPPLKPDVFHLLLALDEGGASHGYALLERIERGSGGRVRPAPSLLYRKLHRLLADGLVEETEGPEQGSEDERRRYYALTPRGADVLRAEAARIVRLAGTTRVRALAKAGRRG